MMKKILFYHLFKILFFGLISPAFLLCESPSKIDPYPYSFKASNPSIVIDSLDNITCIWENLGGVNSAIEGMTTVVNTGFSPSEKVSVSGQHAFHPQITSGVLRDAIAVWEAFDGKKQVIQTSVKPFGKDWAEPITLSKPSEDAYEPKIVAGKGGEVVAIWKSYNGENFIIQSSLQVFDSGWGEIANISQKGCDARHPKLAINPSGYGVAVWELQCGEKQSLIQSSILNPDGTWEEPKNLIYSLENYCTARNPQIAMWNNGEVIAVWQLDLADGSSTIQISIKPLNGNWSVPFEISPFDKKAVNPKIAVSPKGEAVIVWQLHDGGSHAVVQSRIRAADGQWSDLHDIFQAKCIEMDYQIAFNLAGDAIVIWTVEYRDGTSAIYYSTKNFLEPWKLSSKLIESRFKASLPQLVNDSLQHFYALWQIEDINGERFAQFSDHISFLLPDSLPTQPSPTPIPPPANEKKEEPLPPINFKGKIMKNEFLTRKYRNHRLSWKASPDTSVIKYHLYRNGKLIASIPSTSELVYMDYHRTAKDAYKLTAVNGEGVESSPLSLIL